MAMSKRKFGRIINISSEIAIYSPQPFMAYYAITKKMVDTYTDVLRRECNYIGIKVIKIQPGALKTKMLTRANDEYEEFFKSTKYFAGPLKKMKYMMDREITKTFPPEKLATKINKIISKKHFRLPVITSTPIPKGKIMDVIKALKDVEVKAPIKLNDVVVKNVAGLDADIIASKTIEE